MKFQRPLRALAEHPGGTLIVKPTPAFQSMLLLAIAVLVAFSSVVYGLSEPGYGGDSTRYLDVAKNILFNKCVSTTDPLSGICTPHWGGNQFPGYPLLIALAGWLAGLNISDGMTEFAPAIIIMQSIFMAAVVYRMGRAVTFFSGNFLIGCSAALAIGYSPLHFAWSRWILTELTSTAITLWLLAELLICLKKNRLEILPVAIPLIAGFFVRYDSITLCAAVAAAGFMLHRPVEAIRRGALIAILLAIPIIGWSARNIDRGLTVMPMADFGVGHMRGQGYYDWLGTWVSDLYNAAAAAYPISSRKYSKIVVPQDTYLSQGEEIRTKQLLEELSLLDGNEMPHRIEQAFAELGKERISNDPLGIRVILPIKRTLNIYLAPFYSYGWVIELGEESHKAWINGDTGALISIVLAKPITIGLKVIVTGYHVLVLLLFLGLLAGVRRKSSLLQPFLVVLAYVVAKTAFVVFLGQADPRLTIQPYAVMELAILLALWNFREVHFPWIWFKK
jgi:hypothetical protein